MKVYRIDYVCSSVHHTYIEADSAEEAIATFKAHDFEGSEFDYFEDDGLIENVTLVDEDEKDPKQTSMFD